MVIPGQNTFPNNDIYYKFRPQKPNNLLLPQEKVSLEPKKHTPHKIKIAPLIGSALGTWIPAIFWLSRQKAPGITEKLKNIVFTDTAPLLSMSLGAVFGGVIGGIIGDKGENTWNKIKEANFQIISNILMPIVAVKTISPIMAKLTKNSSNLVKTVSNSVGILSSMALGVSIGAFISNKINNSFKKEHGEYKRKICFKDFLAQIDDMPMAFAVSGVKHVDKLLPFCLIIPGYEAGEE